MPTLPERHMPIKYTLNLTQQYAGVATVSHIPKVVDCYFPKDRALNRRKNFCFVTFATQQVGGPAPNLLDSLRVIPF